MITWPKEWDPEEGWGKDRGRPLTHEQRRWGSLNRLLVSTTREKRIEYLGGPLSRDFERSIPQAKQEVRVYFDEHGKRPTQLTSKEWTNWDQWLRKQGSPLPKLCDEMGLPGGLNLERTLKEAKQAIRVYFDEHGKRPTDKTSKEWASWNQWLIRQGSSLPKLCDEMGIPGRLNLERTLEEAKQEIKAYFDEHGKRPSVGTSKEWTNWNGWLSYKGSSLSKLCNEMSLPVRLNLKRTIKGVEQEIRAYFDEHGKRPTQGTSKEWRRWDQWLSGKGSSLPKLCDEIGLPGGLNLGRALEEAKQEIKAYFDEHGKRPSVGTSREWRRWDQWLRRRESSLHQLCNEMGLK